MGTHDIDAARDGPGMKIVDVGHAGRLEDVGPDSLEVDLLWGRLEQDVEGVAQQPPGARDDQQRDQHGRDRVRTGLAGPGDDRGRDDDGADPARSPKTSR